MKLPRPFRTPVAGGARLTAMTLMWAAVLGIAGGLAGSVARLGFRGLQWVATHNFSPSPPDAAASLAPWHRLLVPAAGGLLALAVRRLAQRARPNAAPSVDYVEAVQEGDGTIPLFAALRRTVVAACSIGTGAAIGREGAMIQFAAAFVSRCGAWSKRWVRADDFPLTRQVACGVAAGVATAYQAPLAAIFFAAEIVLITAAPAEFALLGMSAYAGWLSSHLLLAGGPLFAAPLHLHPWREPWWWALALAAAFGLLGPAYQWLIGCMRGARRWPLSLLWSGLAVGAFSLLTPTVWGNGDVALTQLTRTAPGALPAFGSVALILALRSVAVPLCVGTGTVGGVFTPTLFSGAAVAFLLTHGARPEAALLFVLVGMGSLIAAVTHAPLMSSLMTAELTGRWEMFPLLLACALLSSFVASRLSPKTLYGIATEEPHRQHTP